MHFPGTNDIDKKKNKDSFATVWVFLQALRNLHGYQCKDYLYNKAIQRFHYSIRILYIYTYIYIYIRMYKNRQFKGQ